MNKEDTIHADHPGNQERVFQDHQKLKDAIWEVYSEDLKAAQDQDILLSLSSSRGLASRRYQSSRAITETDQREDTAQVSDQAAESNLPNKKLVQITGTNLTSEMERKTNRRSISPQLDEILDFVIKMESERKQEEMEISSPVTDIKAAEVEIKDDISRSNNNNGKIFNTSKQDNKDERKSSLDVNQNMNNNQNYNINMHSLQQTDEEKDKMRLYSKRLRLPGIEQVINKTSFANQRSDYYNRIITASDENDVPYGSEITQQQFLNQQLSKPQIIETMSPGDGMSTREAYPYSLPGRQSISRQPDAPGSFNPSNERPIAESQGCRNSPLLNSVVSKNDSWPFPNVSQGTTTSLNSPQAQFQNNITSQREVSGMLELGIPHTGQTSPSVNKMPMTLSNSQYQKYKTHSVGGCCLSVADGTTSPQMENIFPPNAMVTRSNPSCPFHCNNRPTLVNDNDYQKNLHASHTPLISASVASSKLNQSMHLKNVNAQKQGLDSMPQSPTYSSNQVVSSYSTINPQAVKISPATPPILAANANTLPGEFSQQQTNFVGQQKFQYPTAGSSAPSRKEFFQHSAGQMVPNAVGVNPQSLNYGPKNPESVTQQGFPIKNKSQWSGSYGNASAHYKNLQGYPTPISSPRVQEFSSKRTQELPSHRGQDLPSARHQQFTPPCPQQFPTSRSQEFPYNSNRQFRSQDLPSTSTQEFISKHGQFAASHPELHSSQLSQRISAPIPSTSAMDFQMLNLAGTNQFGFQDGRTSKNYSQLTTAKTPRKRRVTKGISVAQTKRIQKKRKQVEDKLVEYLHNDQCNESTSVIITKHLYHVQSCPNWTAGDDCPLCNQICEMVMHSAECQNLSCPFLYCGINALTSVAEYFSDPKFIYGFLKQLNVSEEEIKEIFVLKNWEDIPTPDLSEC